VTGLFSLSGRTAVVTGAASGIGAETAVLLAEHGARVALGYHPGHRFDPGEVVTRISAAGGTAIALPVDVSDPASVRELLSECSDRLGVPDIAIANAGTVTKCATEQVGPAELHAVLGVDLLGVQYLFAGAVPGMRERGWGRLLATSSTSGHVYGWAQRAAYCAAKAGVVGLVKTYAAEFGPDGITANAVAPGVVRTPMSLDPDQSLGPDGLNSVARSIPVGRVGEPADVAAVYVFLASPAASYVNGQTLIVDGGQGAVEPE
jgi:3-oxoacyl-[acyl-carrier protein] reductase